MSNHHKVLASAVLAAAIGVLGSQARADLGFSFSGPSSITAAGSYTYSLNANWTGLSGVDSVALWDVSGFVSPTLALDSGAVNATLSGPTVDPAYFASLTAPTPAYGSVTDPLYFRSSAVDTNVSTTIGTTVYHPPIGVTATVSGGAASVTVATFTVDVPTFSTGGTLALQFQPATSGAVYPNVVWSQISGGTTVGMSDFSGSGAVSGQDAQVIGGPSLSIGVTGGGPATGIHVAAGQTVTLTSDVACAPGDFSVDTTGKLDVASHYVAVEYTGTNPSADIKSLLIAGRNVPVGGLLDGTWDGTTGITSNTVAAYDAGQGVEYQTVGYFDTAAMPFGAPSTWGSLTLDPAKSYLLFGPGWTGDVAATGAVDDTNFGLVNFMYGDPTATEYYLGDVNFDGVVDDTDFGMVNFLYGSGGPLAPAAFSPAAVPEPASLALLGIGGAALLLRRRRS